MLFIKKILGQVRKAIQDYLMIQDGDKIAIGVSGGKDSLALLVVMQQLKQFYPARFEIEAVTLTLGIGEMDLRPVQELCDRIGVNYTIEETHIGEIVFDIRDEKNPCSLCANLRRGALNNVATKLNCNKVALGHHRDDVIETALLSLFYEGRFHTFSPVTHLLRKEIDVIRPLIYTKEMDIKGFIKRHGIKTVASPCTYNGKTKRQDIKELLLKMNKENKDIKGNIFGAIQRSGIDDWKETKEINN